MPPFVLPLEAALSIRKLQTVDVWAPDIEIPTDVSSVVVPPVWLDENHVEAIRKLARPREVFFSYFLEDVRAENLQKFLQHISCGDHLLILVDQLPKPQQMEILKRIWQADPQERLQVTLKDSRDWPFEEGLKSLPWFLRDRVLAFNPELFFLNELIAFEVKADDASVSAPAVGWKTKWTVRTEKLKEDISFQFWCSSHWSFRLLRQIRAAVLFVFSILWYVKVPFEKIYWQLVGRYNVMEQLFWKLRAVYGNLERKLWYAKVPFEFTYWRVSQFFSFISSYLWLSTEPFYWLRSRLWKCKMPFYWLQSHLWWCKKPFYFLSEHLWRLKKPYYFVRRNIWVVKKPYYFFRRHIWKIKKPYYFARRYIWLLKEPYHFVRYYIWIWKVPYYTVRRYTLLPYHFWRLHAWKMKVSIKSFFVSIYWKINSCYWQVYSSGGHLYARLMSLYWHVRHAFLKIYFFTTYPLRKVYWFCSYQYRKRVVGELNS